RTLLLDGRPRPLAAKAGPEVGDRLDLGDDEAVVGEERAEVGVGEALVVRAPVLRDPEGDAGEAAGRRRGDALAERCARQRAGAEAEVVRSEAPHRATVSR